MDEMRAEAQQEENTPAIPGKPGDLPAVLLKHGEADRVLAGHPWIYAGSVHRLTAPVEDGSLVQVKDHRQRFLGVGFYNSRSKINVRWLAPEPVVPDAAFFEQRIRTALTLRQKHLPAASSFRVVNSESDLLSGLILDKYEDVLVMQISALGMDRKRAEILAAAQAVFAPRAVVERSDVASRRFEGLEAANGLLAGTLEGELDVKLNGLSFFTSVLGGHKTGLYLDQQGNYKRLAEMIALSPGTQVLDCFSFLGGFAIHAARAGAAHVHAIDQSAEANTLAARNAAANGVSEQCSFETANVFDWLKAHTTARPHEKIIPRFDFIVLDPPSFTRNRASVPDALRGYKEIHLRALKLLKPTGSLVTFCCSHHIDAHLFEQAILDAAFDARRWLRRVATFSQSLDHPILPNVPETEYLKGFAFEIVR